MTAIAPSEADILAEAASEGITERTYRNRWKILTALCLALLTAMIANMSMNLALPALGRDLQLTQLQLTWVVESFALVFASLLFIASAVADRYGRKITMQVGLVVFGAASLYAGFVASTGTELIASRLAMGVGAALIMPTTLSIVNVVFPTSQRAKAIAIWSAVSGVGMMFGSVVTGGLLQYFSWESAFLLTGILAVASVLVAARYVPESRDRNATPVDWLGGDAQQPGGPEPRLGLLQVEPAAVRRVQPQPRRPEQLRGERPGQAPRHRLGLLRRLSHQSLERLVQADALGERDHVRWRLGAGRQ